MNWQDILIEPLSGESLAANSMIHELWRARTARTSGSHMITEINLQAELAR